MNIAIIANKWWEAAPLVALLQHVNPRQQKHSAVPQELFEACQPGRGGPSLLAPRLVARCNGVDVEVWCLQDLMDPSENSSLTWEKARVLPRAIRGNIQDALVIAFGTAACPASSDRNGNVVIGTSIFVYDPYKVPPDPKKHWTHALLNQVVASDARGLLDKLPGQFVTEAEQRLLAPPNAPAKPPRIFANGSLVSVGVVNVIKSADYVWADKQALEKFNEVAEGRSVESVETTHGLMRLVLGARFMYVSGLANAVGHFEEHVGANTYSQNFVAAHNAAIALAWLIPELSAAMQSQ
jgi:hypothetical protein